MIFLIVLIILAVAAALAILKMKQPTEDDGLGFARKEPLFTPAERSFLGVLEQSLNGSYRVFGKVRLGDIVKPAKGLSNSKRATSQNKVNQKHVDFVICSASDLAVVGVVELDDKSHERDDRASRDQLVDRALADAKIPVIHFSAKKGYVLTEVKAKLAECLATGAAPSAPPLIQVAPVPEKPASVQKDAEVSVTEKMATTPMFPVKPVQDVTGPICPKCESAMVKRQAMKGPHAGEFFWACSAYPKCRQVVAVGEN
jgi:very-short-patch-repair endonuclease